MHSDIDFLFEIGALRHIDRQWKRFGGINFQNLTEHIYRVIWIAIIIAKYEGASDTGKIIKMALVHDICESRSTDVDYLSRQYVERHEEKAIKEMLAGTKIEEEFLALWHEYEERESLESKIVKDADNLEVDLELRERAAELNGLDKHWQQMREHVRDNKLYTKTAKKLWEEIANGDVHGWHVAANNRYTSGDWSKENQ